MAKVYFVASTVIALPSRDTGVVAALARVHPSRISKSKGKASLDRREPIVLFNTANGDSTLRFALGAGSMEIKSPSAVALDYDAADALGVRLGDSNVSIEVRKASYLSILGFYLTHPDWGYRLATHMGLGGLIFGIIGVVLGTASLLW